MQTMKKDTLTFDAVQNDDGSYEFGDVSKDSENGLGSKIVAGVTAFGISASNAFAGVLTADPVIDLSDVTYIFGGLITFGVVFYGLKKSKSFLGI